MPSSHQGKLNFPAWPQFGEEERVNLLRALDQGQWWRMAGAEVSAFEQEFAAYHGAAHALAVTNGTHALELGLSVLGVRPGDEVLVPAFTFISSSLAVQRLGAVPVPVDVRADTYCVDVAAVERAITPRTRAVMPVHMGGVVCDMDALTKVAEAAGISVIQDAAHAHGATWRGRRIGELGSVAAFSFQNGKLMTAGEGGALLLPDRETYDSAFIRHSCGRPPTDRHYRHQTTGDNLRMNEFSAAVLRAQLGRLEEQAQLRTRRWELLAGLLGQLPGVQMQTIDERCDTCPRYMVMFRLPGWSEQRRNRLVDELAGRGLPAFVAFRAIYRTDGFWDSTVPEAGVDELAARCPQADRLSEDCLWLHHRVLLGDERLMYAIADEVADALARV